MLSIACIIFWQLYHYMLLDIERTRCGGTCLAVRLHPLVQELGHNGLHIDELAVREEAKQLYGKSYNGTQHFLDESHESPKPVQNQQYNNTKVAKCTQELKSGKRL